MKIEIELPDVWEVKITLPNQAYSRNYEESTLFVSLEKAREYMLKECTRMENTMLSKFFKDGNCRFHTVVNKYDYDFTAWDNDGNMKCRIIGRLYEKTIRE